VSEIRKTTLFRRLISRGCLPIPGVFNGATARLVEQAGFKAVYISGAGLANATAGVPDIGLLSLDEVVTLAGYIANAVKIPAIADADTGFGGPKEVARTVREFERIGLAGLHLEDQVFPKRCGHVGGKSLISAQSMADKIRSAVAARKQPDFLIIARTDSRAVEGFEGAVQRSRIYLEAGADAIFPEALQTATEFRTFAKRVRAPLLANMTEFGRSPLLTLDRLQAMGYRMAIFPQTAFRVAMLAEQRALESLKDRGDQRSLLPRMQTREDLYRLLDYDPSSETWPASSANQTGRGRKSKASST
jgi:methylisocitrate lyase